MFRPQLDYCPAPDGFYDEEFIYSFDGTNTPALGVCVAPGQQNQNIPLQMENDAEFIWRATKIGNNPLFGGGVQFKDSFGNYLDDNYVPASLFGNVAYSGHPGSVPTVREPEVHCPKGAIPLLNVANLSATYTPRAVSAATGLGVPQAANSVFPYGNRAYMFVQTAGPGISAVVSTNATTFTASDPTNDIPTVSSGPATYWDRTSKTVYLAYKTAGGAAITLQTFDLSTGKWGATFAPGGPTDLTPQFLWLRANGTFLVLGNSAAFATGYAGVQWNGAAWSAEFDVAVNIEALPGFGAGFASYGQHWSVVDSAGVTHVILKTLGTAGPPNWQNRYFYQQVLQNNTLGVFQEFNAAQQQLAPGNQFLSDVNSVEGNLEIVGTQLVWGICIDAATGVGGTKDPSAAIYVSSNLTTPVWTASASLVPRSLAAGNVFPIARSYPAIRYDALSNTLYAMWVETTATANQITLAFNTSGNFLTGNWQTYVAVPNLGAPFGSIDGPRLVLQNGRDGPYVGFTMSGLSDTALFFAGQPLSGLRVTLRGVKRYRILGQPPICA